MSRHAGPGWLALCAGLLLTAAAPLPDAPSDPGWVAGVTGRYDGTVLNDGRTECHRTEFTLRDGRLVGHYWIDAKEPFEGDLVDFQPSDDLSGTFTWVDRYGTGREAVSFLPDRSAFEGLWAAGDEVPRYPIRGARAGQPCGSSVVSQAAAPAKAVPPAA